MNEPNIRVTKIKNRWHARLLSPSSVVLDEMACECQQDIGWICREMLRWHDKTRGSSLFADAARERQSQPDSTKIGKVWFLKR